MTPGRAPRLVTAMCAAASLLVLAGCTHSDSADGGTTSSSGTTSTEDLGTVDDAASALTETLPVEAVGDAPATNGVADGVLAPTNRWYSSLAYATLPARAFPSPVTVEVGRRSIGVALPTVAASDALIAAQTGTVLTVSVPQSTSRPQVSVNDPVYTSLEFPGEDGPLATATIAEGWPAIGVVADSEVTLKLSEEPTWSGATGTVDIEGTTYAVKTSSATVSERKVTLAEGGWLMAFPIPSDADASSYIEAMGSPLTSVTTTGSEGDTSLEYATLNGGSTVLVPPATVDATASIADDDAGECAAGSFLTIDGPTTACQGTTLSWTVDTIEPTLTLDTGSLDAVQKESVLSAIADDATSASDYPSDTYFGAKELYRDAQLLALANDLGDEDSATLIGDRLATALGEWTDASRCETATSRCFVYDPNWSGVVGYDTAYGSEEFNDHHFHYGYLIYAATIAVEEGVVQLADVAPVIDALVADIASEGSDEVPTTRVFDPYAGHSWASGTAEFADGNNQESSSEAVNAWTAVAAWSQLRGDDAAYDRAVWMLSAEAHSALSLYLRPDTSFAPEYLHQVVGIEWGGKRDWATWFSTDPAAMLGIQLLPLNPTQLALLSTDDDADHTKILASIAEAMPSGTAPQFTDLITMYAALADSTEQATAWDIALTLPESAIDDAMSRAYMLTFIADAG
ncbi:glycosyl hydrolase [Demequina salsinemoris]|uniref:glycosyl hydrolase n=1 Tax=Demequina salsinemoris TaxID=577470 RepID=UPI000780D6DC|nr:glycosyl hydrolase [Demequina salsinemoris]